MYFKSLEIKNFGPIEKIKLEFPFNDNGSPKPVIIVGENGTGKSILIAHLVNTLITEKQKIFDNVEVKSGKVYKLRSPDYIRSGSHYSYSSLEFDSGAVFKECCLTTKKIDFKDTFEALEDEELWNSIPEDASSSLYSTLRIDDSAASTLFKKQCCLYFPSHRFEEPAWLNIDNLKAKASYSELKHLERFSNRNIIQLSPLKKNIDWLLDIVFDRKEFEIKIRNHPLTASPPSENSETYFVQMFFGYEGLSTDLYHATCQIIKKILKQDDKANIQLWVGTRKNRKIQVIKNQEILIPNLFQLSTGEVQLLNLFLSILRDYDFSDGDFKTLADIKGIVIIDEVDSNLHTTHQKEILPGLISLFPGIQFIFTTHSPLFLLGMEKEVGCDNFVIFNMPTGDQVLASNFSEFDAAYEAFKETIKYKQDLKKELALHHKPLVLTEGETDPIYIKTALNLLNEQKTLEQVDIEWVGRSVGQGKSINTGDDGLKRTRDVLLSNPQFIGNRKILLLYDCDTKMPNENLGEFLKTRTIPKIEERKATKGIENLFPDTLFSAGFYKLKESVGDYGEVKRNEVFQKMKFCKWICEERRQAEDFQDFRVIIDFIKELLE